MPNSWRNPLTKQNKTSTIETKAQLIQIITSNKKKKISSHNLFIFLDYPLRGEKRKEEEEKSKNLATIHSMHRHCKSHWHTKKLNFSFCSQAKTFYWHGFKRKLQTQWLNDKTFPTSRQSLLNTILIMTAKLMLS